MQACIYHSSIQGSLLFQCLQRDMEVIDTFQNYFQNKETTINSLPHLGKKPV